MASRSATRSNSHSSPARTSDLLVDRPLQHAHELELAERDQQWQGLLQREQAAHQATRNQFAPEIEQQRDAARTNYWDSIGAVPIENEKADAFIGSVEQLKQQRAQMAHALAENKMEMARQKYGDSFSDAYDTLRAMPNNHPTKQRIVQDLFGAVQTGADPGETLMNYAPMLSQSRREPPFARTRDQQFAPRQADYDRANQATYDDLLQAADSQGYGSEADIFNDVFRRR